MTNILHDLEAAAARKWAGDPDAQQAGLFARAAGEIRSLRAEVVKWKQEYVMADADWQEAAEDNNKLRAAAEQARAALRQSSFCLRECLPDDRDSAFTLALIEPALRALDAALTAP